MDAASSVIDMLHRCAEERGCSDVVFNGTSVWVDCGRGLERRALPNDISDEDVLAAAVRLAAMGGRRLDQSCPVVDARLPDGWRLHAAIPPVAEPYTLISVRVAQCRGWRLEDFIRFGWDPWLIDFLTALVLSEKNVLISGGTGSGKTTLLTALMGKVPSDQRIICIEEVPEVFPNHPHCIHLHERPANVQGEGAVTLSDLVRAAVRMRPNRLVLGECRGAEVRDVMMALNTGHPGSWATIHANSARDVPSRLFALCALSGMSAEAVAAQAASAFDCIIHMGRAEDGQRSVREIAVISDHEGQLCAHVLARSAGMGHWSCDEGWEKMLTDLGVNRQGVDLNSFNIVVPREESL